ncbi:hypothetical protein DPMN_001336, partial [Dreissena polymorpha]
MILKLAALVIFLTAGWAQAINQAVWLEDITLNPKTRNLDLGLPESLQFKLKRSGHQDLTLNLVENKRLNQNAPVYEVHTENHQNKLVKKETSPITDVKFYHDKENGGSFMVECSKRLKGACRRTLTGSLEIHNEAFEIEPTADSYVSRSLAVNKINPHMLTRVVDRTGKGNPSIIARRGHNTEGLENKLAKEIRGLLLKRERNIEKLHQHRPKRQATNTYALEILVGVDPSVWKKYYAKAVATATMTKDAATELFIRKRFSHIINGISLRYESIDDSELNMYVTMTGIIIYKTIAANNPLPNGKTVQTVDGREVADGGFYLDQLVSWLAGLSGKPDNDHAMVFTEYDIYSVEQKKRDYNVIGMAPMNGVCTSERVSIQEDNDYFQTISTAAHELGHNLGSDHDGEKEDAIAFACSADSTFIMAPSTSSFSRDDAYTVNPWHFSKCSVKQFKKYIKSLGKNNCLLDAGESMDEYKIHSSKQPGELYSPAEQCKLEYGQESELGCGQSATDPRICLHMSCKQRDGECTDIAAARGTPCDKPSLNKWCKEGLCVDKGASGYQTVTANNTPTTISTRPSTTKAASTALIPEECSDCTDCCCLTSCVTTPPGGTVVTPRAC